MIFSMCSGFTFFNMSFIFAACSSEISIPACLLIAASVFGSIESIIRDIILTESGLFIMSACIFAFCSSDSPAIPPAPPDMPAPGPPMLVAICCIRIISSGSMFFIMSAAIFIISGLIIPAGMPLICAIEASCSSDIPDSMSAIPLDGILGWVALEDVLAATASSCPVMSSISTSSCLVVLVVLVVLVGRGAGFDGRAAAALVPPREACILSRSSGVIFFIMSALIFTISGVSFIPAGAPDALAIASSCSGGIWLMVSIIFSIASGSLSIISFIFLNCSALGGPPGAAGGALPPAAAAMLAIRSISACKQTAKLSGQNIYKFHVQLQF
mmetsp:Transcript_2669/g.4785  ORF Transcript_2669/g.4785 Transcript_2669/m.4785 type:complete len:328 (+) Transcript_2669:332-1315(+)